MMSGKLGQRLALHTVVHEGGCVPLHLDGGVVDVVVVADNLLSRYQNIIGVRVSV